MSAFTLSYAFLFEKAMCYLIFSYLSEAPVPGVLICGFSFKKLASSLNLGSGEDSELTEAMSMHFH